ncbi:MAG TPA: Hsp20/alpha crystallin family protein [Flavisolibacter sp.]|nr:Hsp20/alpha crystallin family protein [Flavisolibacter sp.]
MTTAIAKRQNGNSSVTFGNVVDNIFQNSLRHFFDDHFLDAGFPTTTGGIPVNVREMENQFEIDVIAPGLKKEDFNLNIEGNVLSISYEHKEQNNDQNDKQAWSRNEFTLRSFTRSFTLDDTVDLNNIQAKYDNGILRLSLPKTEKAKKLYSKIEIE